MKIIVAPDSYKNCLGSREVADAIRDGLKLSLTDAEIITLPLADGGEGTVDALVAASGGEYRELTVCGPLGDPVKARYGLLDGRQTAVIEMAAASGIELLPADRLDPRRATTFGTGELIADALARGVTKIIIGIGGSATCDGGAGMIQALGGKLCDEQGRELPAKIGGGDLDRIDTVRLPASFPPPGVVVQVACDVTNPLTGLNGSAHVYGPQKGADPATVEILDRNLAHWAEAVVKAGLATSWAEPGDGAAGGLGFALRSLLKATISSGAALVIAAAKMEEHLNGADLVVTGEGCTDEQTLSGKLCAVVAATAARHGVPTVIVSGALRGNRQALRQAFAAAFSIAPGPIPLQDALRDARNNLTATAASIGGLLNYGKPKK